MRTIGEGTEPPGPEMWKPKEMVVRAPALSGLNETLSATLCGGWPSAAGAVAAKAIAAQAKATRAERRVARSKLLLIGKSA
jgi:hypothetical protein